MSRRSKRSAAAPGGAAAKQVSPAEARVAAPARGPSTLPPDGPARSPSRRAPASPTRRLSLLHYLLAGSAGALNTMSFAPVAHGDWFAFVMLAYGFWLLHRTRTAREAALTGGAFGFGNFVTGVWWLYVSMHHYGGMAPALAAAAVLLFTSYLALYPALAGYAWHWCCNRVRQRPVGHFQRWFSGLTFASAWALGEWLRGLVFTGFPWLASGYTQVDGLLGGFAAIGGVYAVGWLLAWCATLLVDALSALFAVQPGQRRMTAIAAPLACFAVVLALGAVAQHHAWTKPVRAPLTVRLLQGNVEQTMKYEQSGVDQSVALYQQLITAAPADLIITPETAIPLLIQQLPADFGRTVRDFAGRTGSYVLFGALGAKLDDTGRPYDITNSVFGVDPGTRLLYRYDKNHLVPFGEFVPRGFHWFVQLMNIPLGDASRGPPVQDAFVVHGEPLAPDICYEDIFGEEIARTLRDQPNRAGILVNSTNLGWFGNTVALEQHLQMARMRALETGRPLLSASNNGITAVIDPHGTVSARLAPFTVGSLSATVQGMAGLTPYISWGNIPVCVISLLILLLGVRRHWRGAVARPSRQPGA